MLFLLRLPLLLFFDLLLQLGHIIICEVTHLLFRPSHFLLLTAQVFQTDLVGHFRELDSWYALPVIQDLQQLVDGWSVLRIRNQYDMYQIFELLTNPVIDVRIILRHEVLGVQDTDFAALLIWVVVEGHREDDAAQHPDVDLGVHFVLHILVNHFWRPVHHGGIFLIVFKLLVNLLIVAAHLTVIQDVLAG